MTSSPLSLPLHFVHLLHLSFMMVKFLWICVTFSSSYFKVSLIIWKKTNLKQSTSLMHTQLREDKKLYGS